MTEQQKIRGRQIALVVAIFIVTGFLLPWWVMPAVALAYGVSVGANATSAWRFFADVFIGVFIAWFIVAFAFDARSGFHISARLGGMFHFGFPVGGTLVVSLIGALLASLFALGGAGLRLGLQANR